MDDANDAVLTFIDAASTPPTPLELERELRNRLGLSRAQVRQRIHRQIQRGELTYACVHGRSVLTRSLRGLRQVAPGVMLAAADTSLAAPPDVIVVRLTAGAAFGAGDHPSTRLAIGAIAHLLPQSPALPRAVLDIGTGSGVLALVALSFGVRWAVALDIDPCALAEARANARLNGMQHRFAVGSRPLEDLKGSYGLITANLRPPTLMRLAPAIGRMTAAGGMLILAGMRPDEAPMLLKEFGRQGFASRWQEEHRGWCAIGLEKG